MEFFGRRQGHLLEELEDFWILNSWLDVSDIQRRVVLRSDPKIENWRKSFTLLENLRKSKFAKVVQTCPGPSLTFPDLQRPPETPQTIKNLPNRTLRNPDSQPKTWIL